MARTSLERSHSKASNFKLTLICLLLTLGVSAVWAGAALLAAGHTMPGAVAAAAGAVVALVSFLAIGHFTR
ncbi:MAG: hypothetical protein IJU20_03000 [Clostridia bacterium]|nr:hypothetical protein [Clostridia bacterium]